MQPSTSVQRGARGQQSCLARLGSAPVLALAGVLLAVGTAQTQGGVWIENDKSDSLSFGTARDVLVGRGPAGELLVLPELLVGTVNVGASIATNGAAIASNEAATTTNAAAIASNFAAISTNADAIAANAATGVTNAALSAAAASANTDAIATNAAGVTTNANAIATNSAAISTNAATGTANANAIAANSAGAAANSDAIAGVLGRINPASLTNHGMAFRGTLFIDDASTNTRLASSAVQDSLVVPAFFGNPDLDELTPTFYTCSLAHRVMVLVRFADTQALWNAAATRPASFHIRYTVELHGTDGPVDLCHPAAFPKLLATATHTGTAAGGTPGSNRHLGTNLVVPGPVSATHLDASFVAGIDTALDNRLIIRLVDLAA